MDSPEIIALNCPKCGATLSIPKGLTTLTCNYCHSKLTLFQNDSISALQLVSEKVAAVKEDTDIIASELTLKRLKKELSRLLDEQNSLLTAIAIVNPGWDQDGDYQIGAYIPESFQVYTRYTIEGIYTEKPGVTKRSLFSKKPDYTDRKKWMRTSFSEDDFRLLIEKLNADKERYKNQKKNLAIEKFINQIQELIEINRQIEAKSKQVSETKAKLD